MNLELGMYISQDRTADSVKDILYSLFQTK